MDDLVERLREISQEKQQEAWGRADGGQDLSIGAMLADEAADEITALRARLEAVEKERDECRTLWSNAIDQCEVEYARAERAEAALATAKEDENYDWTDDVPYRSDKGELVLRVEHILTEPVCATACLLWENTGEFLEGFQADTRSEVSKRAVDWAKEHFRALANEAET